MMSAEEVAVQLAEWVKCVAHQPWVFLLLVNVALLLLGIFIEPLPATLLTAPLFMPLAQVFKIDMAHFGMVMTANLAIALYIPAVGGTLFVAANLAKAGIGQITRHLIPLMGATVAMLFLITYFPGLPRVILWLLAR
jgi:C4-dicarboxylate transporter DctM subunit